MAEGGKRRRVPLELWLGAATLLVCAGAFLGPKAYRVVVVRRLASRLDSEITVSEVFVLQELCGLGWEESEAELRGLSARSPMVAYLPREKAVVSAAPRLRLSLPKRAPGTGDFPELTNCRVFCYLHRGTRAFEGLLVGGRLMEVTAAGNGVELRFRPDDPVADRLGLPRGRELRAVLSIRELQHAVFGGEAVIANYADKKADRVWREVFAALHPLLRAAGVGNEPGTADERR